MPGGKQSVAPVATGAPAGTSVNASPGTPGTLAQRKSTLAQGAPKNVAHLDCRIAQPEYPLLSKRRGETGTAYVHFVVGLNGQIENVELKTSSGYSQLDNAALAAMRDSSCKPYLENGTPVRAARTQPFVFDLED